MKIGKMHKCMNCPDRTTEPNCHHPDRCEYWRKVEEERAERYAKRQADAIAGARDIRYAKHASRGTFKAYFGTGNHFRKPEGHTILKGGES